MGESAGVVPGWDSVPTTVSGEFGIVVAAMECAKLRQSVRGRHKG